jgi:hypothetical protein
MGGETQNAYKILVLKLHGKIPLAIICKWKVKIQNWILEKWCVILSTELNWLRIGSVCGLCDGYIFL